MAEPERPRVTIECGPEKVRFARRIIKAGYRHTHNTQHFCFIIDQVRLIVYNVLRQHKTSTTVKPNFTSKDGHELVSM